MTGEQAALLMKMMGDAQRSQIIRILLESDNVPARSLRPGELSAPATSHHLSEMVKSGLVGMTKRKQERLYSIKLEIMEELGRWLLKEANEARFSRLSDFLKDTAGCEIREPAVG